MVAKEIKLLAIAGPTATGKTSLAIDIAKGFNGEIIAVDSRTVYKGLDIGTAKPTKDQQKAIKHWGLDLVEPDKAYSAAQFQRYANEVIEDITNRGKLPILVGGTGLYMDGVIYNFKFPEPNDELRVELNGKTIEELQAIITKKGLPMPTNSQNKVHLITAIERDGKMNERETLREGALIVGLNPDRIALKKIVKVRAQQMLDDGLIGEVKRASNNYGWDAPGLAMGNYKLIKPVAEGLSTEEDGLKELVKNDMRLAKRQMTWLKRNPDINWFTDSRDAKKWLIAELGVK